MKFIEKERFLNSILVLLGLFFFFYCLKQSNNTALSNQQSYIMGEFSIIGLYFAKGAFVNQCKKCGKINNILISDKTLQSSWKLKDFVAVLFFFFLLLFIISIPSTGFGIPGTGLISSSLQASLLYIGGIGAASMAVLYFLACCRRHM